MKGFYLIVFISLMLGTISFYTSIQACVVTFFNNGTGPVLIIDHNNPYNKTMPNAPSALPMVARGHSRRLGKSDEHAHFSIYTKEPKGNSFVRSYEIEQNECAKNGNPKITMTDIKNNRGDSELFTIRAVNSGHSSMVGQLPSLQRADIYQQEPMEKCSACSQK